MMKDIWKLEEFGINKENFNFDKLKISIFFNRLYSIHKEIFDIIYYCCLLLT